MAFARVEGALQKRPEDGRLDLAPVGLCRRKQQVEFVRRQRERRRVLEKPPVEAAQRSLQVRRVPALVHCAPQAFERVGEHVEVVAVALE